jgi:RND family efflux transporter MFP subunit
MAGVPTVVVTTGAAAVGFELDGALEPLRQSTVAAQVPGNVLQLLVKPGDRVAAGQVIARIDDRDAQAALARSDAAVAQVEAELRNARSQLDRSRDLRAQQFVSQAALDAAETQFKAAEAGLRQVQAARTQAALARSFAAVTAPFAGVVLATHLEAGDLAAAGRPIATIYAPGALRAVVQVPGSRLALARAARRVELQLPGSARWVAPQRVTALPLADAVAQTVEWRLDLSPADAAGQLPGATVRVRFAADGAPAAATDAEVPTVPAGALLRRGELTAVYVVRGERFVLRQVRTGATVGAQVQVLAGLQPGERVAADPVRAGLAGATPAPLRP